MKVIHVITGLGLGGAEKFVLNICQHLNQKGFPQKVLVLSQDHLDLLPMFQSAGVEVQVLGIKNNPLSLISQVIRFKKELGNDAAEVIHAHMFHSLIFASLVKVFSPHIKIVFTSHNFNIGSRLREWITYFLKPLRNIDILFSPKMYRPFYKKRHLSIIPNGIPTSIYNLDVKKEEIFTFICVARLEKVKNQQAILESAVKLNKDGFKFKIWLVGKGEMLDDLMSYSKSKDLDSTIVFKGASNEIPLLMNKSHCFLLPSLWEGMPLSVLEAAASGLPIICSPVGSIPDFFSSDLVEYSNPEDLYSSMKNVLDNYEKFFEKGVRLKKYVGNNFDIDMTIEKHVEVYKQLI